MHTGSGSASTTRPQLESPEGTSTAGGGCAAKTEHVFAIAAPANKMAGKEKMYSGDDSGRVEVVNVAGSSGKQHGDDVAKGDKAMDGDDSDGKAAAPEASVRAVPRVQRAAAAAAVKRVQRWTWASGKDKESEILLIVEDSDDDFVP